MPEREVRDAATGAVPIRKVPTSDKDVTARVPGLNVKTAVDVKFDKFWAKYGNDIASGYVDLRIRAVDLEPSSDPSDTAVGDSAIDAAAPSNAKEDDINDDAGQPDTTMNTTSTSATVLYHTASASPSENQWSSRLWKDQWSSLKILPIFHTIIRRTSSDGFTCKKCSYELLAVSSLSCVSMKCSFSCYRCYLIENLCL